MAMSRTQVEVQGTLQPDGTLVLDENVPRAASKPLPLAAPLSRHVALELVTV